MPGHQPLIKYKVTALSTTCARSAARLFPRRQRGITIKIIIVPEVASHARSESAEGKKGEGNRTNVKETICRFQRTAWSYVNARVLVLIAAVNASNFTRLISLSLAESSVRSRRMNETGRKRREKK